MYLTYTGAWTMLMEKKEYFRFFGELDTLFLNEVQKQNILMYNERVGCSGSLTSDRLCLLPCISANPQSQMWFFYLYESIGFCFLRPFFFFSLLSWKVKMWKAQQCPSHVLSFVLNCQKNHAVKMKTIIEPPIVLK